MAEFFSHHAIFQGRNEIEQLEVIFKTCGSISEDVWPGIKDLPWYGLISLEKRDCVLEKELLKLGMTNQGVALLERLLELNPEKRPNCSTILSHEYFVGEHPSACDKSKYFIVI